MARLEGRVAIVTGGARGTRRGNRPPLRRGRRAGRDFRCDRGGGQGARRWGSGCELPPVDVTEEANVKEAVDAVAAEHGRLDILVNNAAIVGPNKLAHETEVADWDRTFAVNVRGPFLCTKHTVRHMMPRKTGAIVNFSSMYGLIGNEDLPCYHSTKGAVMLMTKTDAICYAPFGIRVNAVHPGSIKTEIFLEAASSHPLGRDGYIAEMTRRHPLRLGEPIDIANCVLFLASDESGFVTGASLVADGGYTAQ